MVPARVPPQAKDFSMAIKKQFPVVIKLFSLRKLGLAS